MMFVVIPDYVRNAIDAKLDAALAMVPDAAKDREVLFDQILAYYNDNGALPEFQLVKQGAEA